MSGVSLKATGVRAGVWEGELTGTSEAPRLEVRHGDGTISGVEVTPLPGQAGCHAVRVPIPPEALSDGVQTFLICQDGDTLAQFSVIVGVAMEEDLRTAVDLLRGELDLLKRAFRRHCAETAG